MQCKTFEYGSRGSYRYVVTLSMYEGKILLSQHRDRDTWETQGGHIEAGESPLQAARRELYEECGAVEYAIAPLCDYWAGDEERGAYGAVFVAQIHTLGEIPSGSEMVRVKRFEKLPENLTYPGITPHLFAQLARRQMQEKGERGL